MSEHHHGFDFVRDEEWAKCKCGIKRKNPYYGTNADVYTRAPIGTSTGVHMHAPNQSVPKKWPFRLAVAWLSILGLGLLALLVNALSQTPTDEIFSFLRALGVMFLGGAVFVGTAISIAYVYERTLDR